EAQIGRCFPGSLLAAWANSGLPSAFPLGYEGWGIASEGTHHIPVHMLAQSRVQLAAGAAAAVSPSPSPGFLLAACLPGDLPGASDAQRAGTLGSTASRGVAPPPPADGDVLALAGPAVVVGGPRHRHVASAGRWGVLSGGGQHPHRQNRPDTSVGQDRAAERIGGRCCWPAQRRGEAPVGELPAPCGC